MTSQELEQYLNENDLTLWVHKVVLPVQGNLASALGKQPSFLR
jgi:hypothetical protein